MIDEGTLVHDLYHLEHGATRDTDEQVREAAARVVAGDGDDQDVSFLASNGWYRHVAEIVPGPDLQDPVRHVFERTSPSDARQWTAASLSGKRMQVIPVETPVSRGTGEGDIVRGADGEMHLLETTTEYGVSCRRCHVGHEALAGNEAAPANAGM